MVAELSKVLAIEFAEVELSVDQRNVSSIKGWLSIVCDGVGVGVSGCKWMCWCLWVCSGTFSLELSDGRRREEKSVGARTQGI